MKKQKLFQKKLSVKQKVVCFFSFLFIIIESVITVSIDCYLMKNRSKQILLLPFYVTKKSYIKFILIIVYYKNGK